MTRLIYLAFALLILFSCNNQKSNIETRENLARQFADPPAASRPHAYWCWVNGNFDTVRIKQELQEAKANGMGGFDIWDVWPVMDEDSIIPKGCAFMSDEYVNAIAIAVREAGKSGLEMGLVISSGWNAGGSWTKSENSTMGLYRSELIVESGSKIPELKFPEIPARTGKRGELSVLELDKNGFPIFYKDIAVLAFSVTADSVIDMAKAINLTGKMETSGKLNWEAPQGRWLVVRYVCFPTGQPLIAHSPLSKGPMIDHFNPAATEIHICYFLDKLKKRLGDLSKTALKRLYTDSYEVRGQLWTPALAEEFTKRIGYDMIPFLPALNGYVVKDKETTERFIFDFNKILSDLITENHYAKAVEVCHRYGIEFHAEAAGPGKPMHNCPFESLRSSGVLDAPRGEFWHTQEMPGKMKISAEKFLHYDSMLQVIKGVSSAAHIYNRKYVDAEAFTSTWMWQEGLYDLKPTADRAFCEGLNRIVFHTFAHNPRMAGKPGWLYSFGTVVNANQTWWMKSRPFMDYLGRCSYMLAEGHFVADVLFYYGDESPNFAPCKQYMPSLGYGYDYDYTNSNILINKLSVNNDGKLILPHGQMYSILVLPNDIRMNPDVIKKLDALIADGAIVIGPKPTKYHGLKDADAKEKEIKEIAEKIWGDCDGIKVKEHVYGKGKVYCGLSIREVLAANNIKPDLHALAGTTDAEIDWIHRNADGVDFYMIRNRKSEPITVDLSFNIKAKQPELWNPLDGKITPCTVFKVADESIEMPLKLEAKGSMFVVFSNPDVSMAIDPSSVKQDNEKESLPVEGPWTVYFDKAWGGPDSAVFPELTDWLESKNDSIKYFSGTAKYVKTIDIPENKIVKGNRIILDLGVVAILADVKVNGKEAGILWNKPFIADITDFVKPGANKLEIEVVNRWVNRLIYDAKLPKEKRLTNSSVRRLPNAFSYPMKELPNKEYNGLLPSGLIGPVKITIDKQIKI